MVKFTTVRTFCGITFAALASALPALSQAQFSSTITDLGTLGGMESIGYAINASGQVTGKAQTKGSKAEHAFRWTGTKMMDLGTLGGRDSTGMAINASGLVVGYSTADYDRVLGAFWQGTKALDFGPYGGHSGKLYGVNDNADIVGTFLAKNIHKHHVFLALTQRHIELGAMVTGDSEARGMNAHIQVAGFVYSVDHLHYHAVRWTTTTVEALETLHGQDCAANAINDSGQIAGEAYLRNGGISHAVLWTGTKIADLGTLGGKNCRGYAINASGEVVGQSDIRHGGTHAFLYTKGRMRDLNTLLPKGSGWRLTEARGINDNGWITGQGTFHGQKHAFLLRLYTPKEPK